MFLWEPLSAKKSFLMKILEPGFEVNHLKGIQRTYQVQVWTAIKNYDQ